MKSAAHDIRHDTLSVDEALRDAAQHLRALPQAEPRLEAELLLMKTAGLAREQIIAWPERRLGSGALNRFRALVERRLSGEPIAYIRGRQAFWTLDLRVTPDTLIPRPETELLVEIALDLLPANQPLVVADAGTGSGAIAAALACERPAWTLIAVEREAATAQVAAGNLRHHAPDNAHTVRGDWIASLSKRCLDAVIGNPPYIRELDPHLKQGDLPYEPINALAAGPDGLGAIRRIAFESAGCLRPDGLLALEHGFDQGAQVRGILAAAGYRNIETRPDLSGLDRATMGHLRP